MKKKFIGLGVLSLMLIVGSCNKEYDFDKIDGTAVIGQNLSVPIDGRDTVLISKIITVKPDDIIKIDDITGNYFLYMSASNPTTQSFSIPAFSSISSNMKSVVSDIGFPPATTTQPFDTVFPIINSTSVDQIIKSINNISGKDSYFQYTIVIAGVEQLTLNGKNSKYPGFKIECPKWLVFAEPADGSNYSIDGSNILLNNNELLTPDDSLIIKASIKNIDVTKFDGKNSYFRPGQLRLNDIVKMSGSATIEAKTSDVTASIIISPKLFFTPERAEIEAQPDIKLDIKPVAIDKGKLPEILQSDTTVLDLGGDFSLIANVSNEFPNAITMNTGISTVFKKEDKVETQTITQFEKDFTFDTTEPDEYKTDAQSVGIRNTVSKKSLFIQMPDSVKIVNTKMALTAGFFNVTFGDTYNVKFNASFKTPLCLGKELKIYYTYKLDFAINLGEGTKIHDATLNIKFHNKLPFDVGVKPAVVDTTGKVIDNIKVDSDITLKAGSLENPVDTDAQIFLTSEEGFSSFSGLKFDLLMQNGTDKPLNKDMGITFDNISLHTEKGIFFNIKK